jgi:hypothetical protein
MNDNATLLIYKLNRSSVGASVEQVCAPIKASAFPSIANRNQMITIQLSGDNADNSRTNLQVIDMQGKVLNQQTIPAGQTSTTIPAHRLSNGMNLIKITLQKTHSRGKHSKYYTSRVLYILFYGLR